ncbi:MAG TPA: DNA recombination protein RmuC, partial [Luteibacter sp.]|nr:DNA recombination protein RmuC [Luteibacter sp.]
MTPETILLILLLVVALACLGLLVALLSRGKRDDGSAARFDALRDDSRRLEAVIREEQRAGRGELG